jgi:hypothetical protein
MTEGLAGRRLLTPDHPYWEKCARHSNKQTCRFVAHLFLCDACAERLKHECFNDRPPMFEGLVVNGFCGLCNRRQDVLLRQWFVCQICLGVILSYPKTIAASLAVHDFWSRVVKPEFPGLKLEETEVVKLAPFIPGRRTKRVKSETLAVVDFAVFDDSTGHQEPVFYIEMKSGPGSIDEMSEFQLDINDSNDVATVCNKSGIPAYIIHVQVREEYAPPTRHSVATGMWWTDCFALQEHLLSIKPRRGEEDKSAGYYSPQAFRTMESFKDELSTHRYIRLQERLKSEALPLR